MTTHITDQAAWRDAWDDDLERTRIVHRVGAAINSGKDAAVIEVVIDEVKRATHPQGRDEEIARRIEWATGRNGWKLLRALRIEGLGVVVVAPEKTL